jgi:hypothetical protein
MGCMGCMGCEDKSESSCVARELDDGHQQGEGEVHVASQAEFKPACTVTL